MWFASKKKNRRILFAPGLKDSDIGITRIDLFYQICFAGFSSVYMPFHFNMLQVLGLLISRGVFRVFLFSAHQPCMTRVLIFPIFTDTPEYISHVGLMSKI